jgi:Large polyvalent protein associated domain 23/ADP-Ribosyltransferase in polyvalent proteins
MAINQQLENTGESNPYKDILAGKAPTISPINVKSPTNPYQDILDAPAAPKTPLGKRIVNTLPAIGQTVLDVPTYAKGYVANLAEGTHPMDENNVFDKWSKEANELSNQRQSAPDANDQTLLGTKGDWANTAASIPFSVGSMGAAIGAGALTGLATKNPVAAYGAGSAASGVLAHRADSAMFMRQGLDTYAQDYQQKHGIPPSDQELKSEQDRLQPYAFQHGLAEAIPEAIGTPLAGKLVGNVFRGSGNLGYRAAKAAAGIAAEELPTETLTQQLQNNVQVNSGVDKNGQLRSMTSPDDWKKSFGEVAVPVLQQSLLMGAGAGGLSALHKKLTAQPVPVAQPVEPPQDQTTQDESVATEPVVTPTITPAPPTGPLTSAVAAAIPTTAPTRDTQQNTGTVLPGSIDTTFGVTNPNANEQRQSSPTDTIIPSEEQSQSAPGSVFDEPANAAADRVARTKAERAKFINGAGITHDRQDNTRIAELINNSGMTYDDARNYVAQEKITNAAANQSPGAGSGDINRRDNAAGLAPDTIGAGPTADRVNEERADDHVGAAPEGDKGTGASGTQSYGALGQTDIKDEENKVNPKINESKLENIGTTAGSEPTGALSDSGTANSGTRGSDIGGSKRANDNAALTPFTYKDIYYHEPIMRAPEHGDDAWVNKAGDVFDYQPHEVYESKDESTQNHKAPTITQQETPRADTHPAQPENAIEHKAPQPADVEGKDSGVVEGLDTAKNHIKVRDVYGNIHQVSKDELDSGKYYMIGVYENDGHRRTSIHREKILADQNAPTPYFENQKLIGTKETKQHPNGLAFKNEAAAKAMQTKHHLQNTHDVVKNGNAGGFVLKRKQVAPSFTKPEYKIHPNAQAIVNKHTIGGVPVQELLDRKRAAGIGENDLRQVNAWEKPTHNDIKNAPAVSPATASQEWQVPEDAEKRANLKQLLEDAIKTNKLNGRQVNQESINRLAKINLFDKGEQINGDAIYSNPVSGHPENIDQTLTRNLVPIMVRSTEEALRKLDNAQKVYADATGKLARANYGVKMAKTPAEKKKATAELARLRDKEAIHAEGIDALNNETMPELQRLYKEAVKKYGEPNQTNQPLPIPANSNETALDESSAAGDVKAQAPVANSKGETRFTESAARKILESKAPQFKDVTEHTHDVVKDGDRWQVMPMSQEPGKIGDKLRTGETRLTASGRRTTPFPNFTNKNVKNVDTWLLNNAYEEAKARNDEFNARMFKDDMGAKVIPTASKDSAEEYLFGTQPEVQKPITKPLINKESNVKENDKAEEKNPVEAAGTEKPANVIDNKTTPITKKENSKLKPLATMIQAEKNKLKLITPAAESRATNDANEAYVDHIKQDIANGNPFTKKQLNEIADNQLDHLLPREDLKRIGYTDNTIDQLYEQANVNEPSFAPDINVVSKEQHVESKQEISTENNLSPILQKKSPIFWKGETWETVAHNVIKDADVRLKKNEQANSDLSGGSKLIYSLSDGRRTVKIPNEVGQYIEKLQNEKDKTIPIHNDTGTTPEGDVKAKGVDEVGQGNVKSKEAVSEQKQAPKDDEINIYGVKNQPRLAENADDLYKAFKELSEKGVVTNLGLTYPVARDSGGNEFQVKNGIIEKLSNEGSTSRSATKAEIQELHDDFDKDQIQVLNKSNWGGSGRDTSRKTLAVLHSPRGVSFNGAPNSIISNAAKPFNQEAPNPIEAHKAISKRIDDGDINYNEYKAAFENLIANKAQVIADLSKLTLKELEKEYPSMRTGEKKDFYVNNAYHSMLGDFHVLDGLISWSSDPFAKKEGSETGYEKAIRREVEKVTDADLKAYADKVAAAREERAAYIKEAKAGMENPKTIEDFGRTIKAAFDENKANGMAHGAAFQAARMTLTPEQREQYDNLVAETTRSRRIADKAAQQSRVSAPGEALDTTEIINTKHTKLGHDLWQFNLTRRVESAEFKDLALQAKKLGGNYSSYRGGGAIPGWQFRTEEAAKAFKALVGGDATEAKEVMQARRDAFADDRSQSATERLAEMADSLEEKADESLNRDRKTNTHKRAGEAARAEANAESDKAMAQTMRNIANAIKNGTAELLDRVRQKVQVEMLQTLVSNAQSEKLRKLYPDYATKEKHRGEKPNKETADYAEFPQYSAWRSNIASLGRELSETEGTKKLGQQIMKVADDMSDAYLKFAKDNLDKVSTFSTKGGATAATFASKPAAEAAISRSGFKGQAIVLPVKRSDNRIILSPSEAIKRGIWEGDDKLITLSADLGNELVEKIGKAARRGAKVSVPYQFETAYNRRKRLANMGIETAAELRVALREFIGLQEAPKEADKIKEMERAMIGRANDGLDFFPTPAAIADEMVEAADIKEGMSVLEPSAGMGHIAERIRDSGVEPDVIEMSNARKELLEAKGFNVVGRDFMDADQHYDRIIMNPPFGDRRDVAHVQHAYDLLNPGGRLVAIMGEGVFFGSSKKDQAFRDWLEQVGGTEEKLPEGSFKDAALPVNTGVNARMVVIQKEGETPLFSKRDTKAPLFSEHNRLSNIDKNGNVWKKIVDENPTLKNNNGTVTIYRYAIGKDLRFNDYVAINKDIAIEHRRNLIDRGEKPVLIKQNVKLSDLIMANDATEFVYAPIEDSRFSKGQQTPGSTISQITALLPNRVKGMLAAGKLVVMNDISEVPSHIFERGNGLFQKGWHGSPYNHDYFDNNNIGSGEGALGFGYGTYFTKTKAGAIEYKRKLQRGRGEGKVYKTEIPDSKFMLDLDKNTEDQSQYVRDALLKIPPEAFGFTHDIEKTDSYYGTEYTITPEDAKQELLHNYNGKSIYAELVNNARAWGHSGQEAIASMILQDAGIKGNTHTEFGERNFVVFDDADLEILAKYSKDDMKSAEGFYDPKEDKLYLFANNLNKDNLQVVLSHELLHRAEAKDPATRAALKRFEQDLERRFNLNAKGIGTKEELDAYRRVINADTPVKDQQSEYIAYMGGLFAKSPNTLTGAIKQAFQRLIAAIRMALVRSGLDMGMVRSLTPADLWAMSKYGAAVNQKQSAMTSSSTALGSAKEQGYNGNDKGEAFEWLRAKAKGLDMSQAARMERARAMGFDINNPWYHWTDSKFDEFDLNYGDIGIHFGTKSAAYDRAKGQDKIEYEIETSKDGKFEVWSNNEWLGDFDTSKEAKAFIKTQPKEIAPIEVFVKEGKVLKITDVGQWYTWPTIQALPKGLLSEKDIERIMSGYGEGEKQLELNKVLQEKGIVGLIYKNEVEDKGSMSYIALNPSSIRSINAAFDPDFKDSGNLLASAPATRFYSALRRAFTTNKIPKGAMQSAQGLKQWLSNSGNLGKFDIKRDEVYWTGINDWLDTLGKAPVSVADVDAFLADNGVKVEDVVLSKTKESDIDTSKWTVKYDALPAQTIERMRADGRNPPDGGYRAYNENNKLISSGYSKTKEDALIASRHVVSELLPTNSKYATSNYTMPGGKNYKELILTVPTIESWGGSDSAHFGDISDKNIGWARMDTRTDKGGNEGLFVNEFQSKRGMEGRANGFYNDKEVSQDSLRGLKKQSNDIEDEINDYIRNQKKETRKRLNLDEYDEVSVIKDNDLLKLFDRRDIINDAIRNAERRGENMQPGAAPFVSDSNNKATEAYIKLLMKKAISSAIDEGKTFVAWTTGTQQADFYDLAKTFDKINVTYNKSTNDYDIVGIKDKQTKLWEKNIPETKLVDYIGKDLADKVVNGGQSSFEGAGLRIEPNWTSAMYGDEHGNDKNGKPSLITQAANDIAKKMGGKVGNVNLDMGTQPALIITPVMRDKVLNEGMPLFSFAGKSAKTADQYQLSNAQQRLDNGDNAEQVRQDTGWFKGVDGKWRFEIDDSDVTSIDTSKFKTKEGGYGGAYKTGTLKDALGSDSKILQAYPNIGENELTLYPFEGQHNGTYRNYDGNGDITIWGFDKNELISNDIILSKNKISTLLHEIQHSIQETENFAQGGQQESGHKNPGYDVIKPTLDEIKRLSETKIFNDELDASEKLFTNKYERKYDAIGKLISNAKNKEERISLREKQKNVMSDFAKESREKFKVLTKVADMDKSINFYDRGEFISPWDWYKRLAGEVEARNVQARQNLTQEQRKTTPPSSTQDVNDSDAIVIFNGKEMASAPANADQSNEPLLAPNGKPSNLNAMQYAQVRTPEFKAWFGDWLNDPENASKVVDENGEPLVVYHGSPKDIERFNTGKAKKGNQIPFGAHFTTNKDIASQFGEDGSVYSVFLNIKYPLDIIENDYPEKGSKESKIYESLMDKIKQPYFYSDGWVAAPKHGLPRAALKSSFDSIRGDIGRKTLIDNGYDGAIYEAGYSSNLALSMVGRFNVHDKSFIALNPNQIKSSTGNTGEFNPNNNDIRFSIADNNKKLTTEEKQDFLNKAKEDYADIYNKTIRDLKRDKKPLDTVTIYAAFKAKLAGRQSYLDKLHAPQNLHWDVFTLQDYLLNNGFEFEAESHGHPRTKGSPGIDLSGGNSLYYINKKTGVSARISDHRPVYARSFSHLQFYPGSYPSYDDAIKAIDDAKNGIESIRFSIADNAQVQAATNAIADHMKSAKTFNVWHKTVGTQYHKAIIDKDFGRVFNTSMALELDAARIANEIADLAKTLLPKTDRLKDVVHEVLGGGFKRNKDALKVGKEIFDTTLNDKPMTDDELDQAGLTHAQKTMYHEFFAAVNHSLDELAKSEMYRAANVLNLITNPPKGASLKDTAQYYADQTADPIDAKGFKDKAEAIQKLKDQGYAPLMRFGRYTLDVTEAMPDGTESRPFFGMFETEAEANQMKRSLQDSYPNATIKSGVMSQKDWEMFKGVTPETMQVMADIMGKSADEAFQTYLAQAVNNRSALKRLIHRKKMPGFASDPQRILASFITSNAKSSAKNIHLAEMMKAITDIPKAKGDVIDEAVDLYNYVQNPAAAGAAIRTLLFTWYLGGSVASAAVNLTQSLTTTLPYLHQFGTTAQVSKIMGNAMRLASRNISTITGDLHDALKLADDEGVTAPHELHMLYGESMRTGMLQSKLLRPLGKAWGSLFSLAESYNRRVAFIAAYTLAKQNNMSDPFKFASEAVDQTQFIYSKSSRPNWARSTVGSMAFTFKTFTINYLEFIKRLPPQEKAIALGVLALMAGLSGLPGADDADDIIDTIGQYLGYNTNSKEWKEKVVSDMIGREYAKYMLYGMSHGTPFDISSRVSVGNVIPGSAMLKKSETDKSRDVMEFIGPAGSLIKKGLDAYDASSARTGVINKGAAIAKSVVPKAISDAWQAMDMMETGHYRDARGRNVTESSDTDALVKAIGFQPENVAEHRRQERYLNQDVTMAKTTESDIADLWGRGVFEKDASKVMEAKQMLLEWNAKNPDTPIRIAPQQIMKRVRAMRMTSEERMKKTTPRELRGYAKNLLDS